MRLAFDNPLAIKARCSARSVSAQSLTDQLFARHPLCQEICYRSFDLIRLVESDNLLKLSLEEVEIVHL
jgi:hypothetical protein